MVLPGMALEWGTKAEQGKHQNHVNDHLSNFNQKGRDRVQRASSGLVVGILLKDGQEDLDQLSPLGVALEPKQNETQTCFLIVPGLYCAGGALGVLGEPPELACVASSVGVADVCVYVH